MKHSKEMKERSLSLSTTILGSRTRFIRITFLVLISFVFLACNRKNNIESIVNTEAADLSDFYDSIFVMYELIPIDSLEVEPFFTKYPAVKKYEKDLTSIYQDHNFSHVWFDQKGVVIYGNSLYAKVKDIESEGIFSTFPYQEKIDSIFERDISDTTILPEEEFLLTCLYLFYFDVVYKGIDDNLSNFGWLLPRKKLSYTAMLDSIISDKKLQNENSLNLFGQYYKLRNVLKRYRTIEQNGGWLPIELEPDKKVYQPNDSSAVIQQIRERLYITGEIKENNKSAIYDEDLLAGIQQFQLHNGYQPDSIISQKHIAALNIPVEDYIKKIIVNMERCRWVPPQISKAKEFIFVNIPAFHLDMYRDGKIEFESAVVVGSELNKTVIFDGMMTYIVFSPYWNIPKSIIRNEVLPGMEKDENYLSKRNMDWNDGNVRQRPGRNNSLGLVKFIFPNSNNIYLHDSPAKSLFEKEDRAKSHGCIRVAKAREMALKILEDDEDWPVTKIDAAMKAGKEKTCVLKNEIPVYIGYFTAWVDIEGQINFYKDVYKRDERLAEILIINNTHKGENKEK